MNIMHHFNIIRILAVSLSIFLNTAVNGQGNRDSTLHRDISGQGKIDLMLDCQGITDSVALVNCYYETAKARNEASQIAFQSKTNRLPSQDALPGFVSDVSVNPVGTAGDIAALASYYGFMYIDNKYNAPNPVNFTVPTNSQVTIHLDLEQNSNGGYFIIEIKNSSGYIVYSRMTNFHFSDCMTINNNLYQYDCTDVTTLGSGSYTVHLRHSADNGNGNPNYYYYGYLSFETNTVAGETRAEPIIAGTFGSAFSYSDSQYNSNFSNQYAGQASGDIFYRFTLSQRMEVTMTHCGSGIADTYMYLLDTSGNLIESNDNYASLGACSNTKHSYIKRDLVAGTYYVVSEGGGTNTGMIQTHISGTLSTGETMSNPVMVGTFSNSFQYADIKNTSSFNNAYNGQSTNDVYYRFILSQKMLVRMTHCGSTLGDTYMHLLNASGALIVSNDNYTGANACSNTNLAFIERELDAGTYYLVSEGKSANGSIQTNITGFGIEKESADFFDNPFPGDATSPSTNGIVGATEGSLNVSPSGAATYGIPIKLPPGTGGMTPELSIVYNSQGGDGYLGMGFSLAGLSEIARVPERSFLGNNGYLGTPTLTFGGDDRFALDGQQLMSLSYYYGEINAEYRTENNEFSRIKTVGGSLYLPQSFKVWTKSGLIYEYGTTDNSRVKLSDGKVVRWLLDKVTDTKGNYFTVTYDNDATNGVCYPLRIDYTGNASASPALQPYCSVRFSYSSRTTTNMAYVQGTRTQTTKKLDYIRAYYDQTIVKTYEFQYNYSDYTLKSVQETGKDGKKYNPTTFEWYANSNYTPVETIYDSPTNLVKAEYTFGDFNGDGKMDIVATPMRGATWREWRVFFSTGTSFSYRMSKNEGDNFKPETLKDYQRLVYTGDFNGDGKTDILVCNRHDKYYNYRVHLSTGSGFETPYLLFSTDRADHEIRVGDCNGNGISDINVFYKGSRDHELYRYDNPGSENPYYKAVRYLPSGVVWDRIETGDFNGDGMMDVLNLYEGGHVLGICTGSNPMQAPTTGTWPNKNHHIHMGDFNGDGKTDMLITGSGSHKWDWQMHYGNGIGFVKADNDIPSKFDIDTKQIIVCDINGDGRDDFIAVKKSSNGQLSAFDIYLTNLTGTNFTLTNGFNAYGVDMWRFQPADFNGDGRADILCSSLTGSWTGYQMYNTPAEPNMLVKKITDGIGFEQEIVYKKMTDNTVYQAMGTYVYPLSAMMAPLNLVYETKTADGIGGWATTRYKYAGARVQKTGKGMLGFTEFTVTDVPTNTVTTTTFEVEPTRYATAVKKTETRVGSKLVSSTEYVNEFKRYNGTAENYKTIYTYLPVKVTDQKYEFSSPATTPYQTTTTRYHYDDYGNVDRTSIRYSATDSVVNVNSEYDNIVTADKWHLGRLKTATVTKYSGGQSATSTSTFTYDAASGLLTSESVQPLDGLGYRKTYQHDKYGNITQSTTKGITQTDSHRTQKTEYDDKGRFVKKAINSLGHAESQAMDPYLGATDTKTSPNGLVTRYKFDGFGQTTGGTSPDGNQTVTHLLWNKGHADAPANAAYYSYSKSSGSPATTVFYDRLGRELRWIGTGFDGALIFVDTEYNSKGQVYRVSEPYFKGGTPVWTVREYDGLGRVTKYTLPDGSTIKTAYNGFTTTVTNQLNQVEKKTVDAQGRLTVSEDNIGGTVTYSYNANGNVVKVTGPRTVINKTYDGMGNLTQMEDPDLGNIEYKYNIFGETVYRKHLGKSLPETTFTYDSLGRMTQRVEPEGTTNWVYDTKKSGLLSSVTHTNGSGQEYFYDEWCRVTKVKENITAAESYETATTYDQYGRTDKLTYPNNALTVQHVYNSQGYLQQVKNTTTGQVYWTAQQMNARGQLERFALGNGLQTTRTYQEYTGHLQTIRTTKAGGGYLQDWSYTFDAIGNLSQRKDVARGKYEDFEYDRLNRLVQVRHNNTLNLEMAYDAAGNITKKTDLGDVRFNYIDGTNKLECIQPTTTGSSNYTPGEQLISYTSFDKVGTIEINSDDQALYNSLQITYGTAHQRIQATTCNVAGVTAQRTYVGALYEKEFTAAGNETKHIYYIFAGDGAVVIYTESNTTGNETVYLHKDHLGSIVVISTSAGALKQELSYDVWGNRRDPVTWALASITPLFARGFTGHEHLDLFALVNMNGRVYDPVIGRFLSADPYMQAPDFTQGLNRYIYCLNNPLSLTDPSGYSWLSDNWKSLVAAVVGIAVTVVTAGSSAPLWLAVVAGAAGGAAGGITGALLNGANFGQIMKAGAVGAFWGAVTAAVGGGIGCLEFDDMVGTMLAHGISQGAISAAQGGKFQHGFFAGALSSGAAPEIMKKFKTTGGQVLASSVVGGTSSVLGGGKFANGAITGAYVMLFNHIRHKIEVYKSPVSNNYGNQDGECVLRALEEYCASYGMDEWGFDFWYAQNGSKLGVHANYVETLINSTSQFASSSIMPDVSEIITAIKNNERVLVALATASGGEHGVMVQKVKIWPSGRYKIYFAETSPVRIAPHSTSNLTGLGGIRLYSFAPKRVATNKSRL